MVARYGSSCRLAIPLHDSLTYTLKQAKTGDSLGECGDSTVQNFQNMPIL